MRALNLLIFKKVNTAIVGAVLALLALVLVACQPAYVKLDAPNQKRLVLSKAEADAILAEHRKKSFSLRQGEDAVAVYCTGLYECQLASIDDNLVVNDESGLPFRSAVKNNVVSLVEDASGKPQEIGTTHSGKHDISIRIYPTPARLYEQFTLVDTFEPDSVYRIHAYRKMDSNNTDMSLLALATPKPLCIKVYKDGAAIRQFCKVSDITTGLGEFEETKVDKQYSDIKDFLKGLISNSK